MPNCNFRCPFCHNYGLIFNPAGYKTIPFEKLKRYLIEHKDFLDGICLTGGEPTIYNDLPQFLQNIKKLGLKIKLDTNGTSPKMLDKVINQNLIDYIAMDIKAPLNIKYEKLAGVSVDLFNIKKNIKIIMNSQIDYEFRTTVVPTLLNTNDIIEISKEIKSAKKFALQQFEPSHAMKEELRDVKPYDKNSIEEMLKNSKKYVKNMIIRGLKE